MHIVRNAALPFRSFLSLNRIGRHRCSHPSRLHSMSATTLPADLPKLLAERYDSAVASGSAFFYPSEIHRVQDQIEGSDAVLNWSIRRCEALRQKALEKKQKEEEKGKNHNDVAKEPSSSSQNQASGSGQNPNDVFAPPYDEHLLVAELGDHTLLLNKFALIPQHFLLVTREFRSQGLPPKPETLALSYRILTSLPSKEADDRLCFFNCGPDSGASQPHCHMQFVDLNEGGGVLIEEWLDRIQRDGKEFETVHALPLPYQHFVHLLPPSLNSRTPEDKLVRTLAGALMKLLDAMFTARTAASLGEVDAAPRRRGSASWNLLLTPRAMHLIPRELEEYPLQDQGPSNAEVGPLSLNALCFAGHLVTKSNEEIDRIRQHAGGVSSILGAVGRRPVLDHTVASTGTEGGGELK